MLTKRSMESRLRLGRLLRRHLFTLELKLEVHRVLLTRSCRAVVDIALGVKRALHNEHFILHGDCGFSTGLCSVQRKCAGGDHFLLFCLIGVVLRFRCLLSYKRHAETRV